MCIHFNRPPCSPLQAKRNRDRTSQLRHKFAQATKGLSEVNEQMVILELARQGDLEKMSSNVEQIVADALVYAEAELMAKFSVKYNDCNKQLTHERSLRKAAEKDTKSATDMAIAEQAKILANVEVFNLPVYSIPPCAYIS